MTRFLTRSLNLILKKIVLRPGALRTWDRDGQGHTGAEYPYAASSYSSLALVSVPGSMSRSPGAPAVVLISPSLPGSPCPFSAPEWAALPGSDPEVVLPVLPVSCLSSDPQPRPRPAPSC